MLVNKTGPLLLCFIAFLRGCFQEGARAALQASFQAKASGKPHAGNLRRSSSMATSPNQGEDETSLVGLLVLFYNNFAVVDKKFAQVLGGIFVNIQTEVLLTTLNSTM